jgi:hypothetical protein
MASPSQYGVAPDPPAVFSSLFRQHFAWLSRQLMQAADRAVSLSPYQTRLHFTHANWPYGDLAIKADCRLARSVAPWM